MDSQAARIQLQQKSLFLALILTIFFGGLGVLYVSIIAGIIFTILEGILWVITFLTFGFGYFLVVFLHVVCVIYAAIAVNSHNKKLLRDTFGA